MSFWFFVFLRLQTLLQNTITITITRILSPSLLCHVQVFLIFNLTFQAGSFETVVCEVQRRIDLKFRLTIKEIKVTHTSSCIILYTVPSPTSSLTKNLFIDPSKPKPRWFELQTLTHSKDWFVFICFSIFKSLGDFASSIQTFYSNHQGYKL